MKKEKKKRKLNNFGLWLVVGREKETQKSVLNLHMEERKLSFVPRELSLSLFFLAWMCVLGWIYVIYEREMGKGNGFEMKDNDVEKRKQWKRRLITNTRDYFFWIFILKNLGLGWIMHIFRSFPNVLCKFGVNFSNRNSDTKFIILEVRIQICWKLTYRSQFEHLLITRSSMNKLRPFSQVFWL